MTAESPNPSSNINSLVDKTWFTHDRFGLFIHWGLYTLPARHEWIKSRERISDDDYQKYFDHFEPDLYDPEVWAQAAENAGMKYFVITTKHHEGFCLWDSALTDYKAPNTPIGRDLLTPAVQAFRKRGFKVGFYHSLLDWHHPDFPVDVHHPMRDDQAFRAANANRDVRRYTNYLHGQTRELLTQFGQIDLLWYDFSYSGHNYEGMPGKGKDAWQSEQLLKMVHELQPHILVNDRLEMSGDIYTPEEYQPREWMTVGGQRVTWEACQTFNDSWGYYRAEHEWRTTDELIRTLIDTVSKGGNMLLNVIPNGRGEFDPRALERLHGIGQWMHLHSRAIYGCSESTFTPPADCRYTQNGNRLYLHLFAYPYKHVHLPGLADRVEYAQLLSDASEIPMRVIPADQQAQNVTMSGLPPGTLTLELPLQQPNVAVPVIELFLKN